MSDDKILKSAVETLKQESVSLLNAINYIDTHFVETLKVIFASKGRAVVTGIGKSAIVGQKIVATFNSTGTPAIFMHAADAIHGDLGIIQKNDVVICISNSGNTPEIKVLASLIKNLGNVLVAITGNLKSFLAEKSDYVINSHVEKEACPHNLAPTSSTTVQMALGDAMAVALLQMRGFTAEDFAKYHPGGNLGKLFIKVEDFARKNEKPMVKPDTPLQDVIVEISSKRLGAAAVVDNDNVVGIITDGDIRRLLQKTGDISGVKAKDLMSSNPKTVSFDTYAVEAVKLLKENSISQLIVLKNGAYYGMVHFHDFLREGIL
ncbi:MAG: KpsF/GutQ family sugar-phosphate isomerase [Bacteroidetes bacterium]|nr:MAG: KpsF/GutQ family sugar-phosphate isomerase [Bacteroidota bacterium]